MDDDERWLAGNAPIMGLTEARVLLPGELYAGLSRMVFTTAIVIGEIGDASGYLDRWCYNDYDAAKEALEKWVPKGHPGGHSAEPSGWHRHPRSGRRISQTGLEIDDQGKRVERPGVMYVRR